MLRTADWARIALVLVGALLAAGSATSNSPPPAVPWGQPAGAAPPAAGGCDHACGQLARCQLAEFEACVAKCRQDGTEQQAGGPEGLDRIARASCEQLAAASGRAAPAAPEPAPPPVAPEPVSSAGGPIAGAWQSMPYVSVTNPAMAGAHIHLDIKVAGDGSFQGTWGMYMCLVSTYGVSSCSNSRREGRTSGRLAPDGTGAIDLERTGRSSLTWKHVSPNEILIELPRSWQEGVLFRSTIKR